jgi:hypothetical protein
VNGPNAEGKRNSRLRGHPGGPCAAVCGDGSGEHGRDLLGASPCSTCSSPRSGAMPDHTRSRPVEPLRLDGIAVTGCTPQRSPPRDRRTEPPRDQYRQQTQEVRQGPFDHTRLAPGFPPPRSSWAGLIRQLVIGRSLPERLRLDNASHRHQVGSRLLVALAGPDERSTWMLRRPGFVAVGSPCPPVRLPAVVSPLFGPAAVTSVLAPGASPVVCPVITPVASPVVVSVSRAEASGAVGTSA